MTDWSIVAKPLCIRERAYRTIFIFCPVHLDNNLVMTTLILHYQSYCCCSRQDGYEDHEYTVTKTEAVDEDASGTEGAYTRLYRALGRRSHGMYRYVYTPISCPRETLTWYV